MARLACVASNDMPRFTCSQGSHVGGLQSGWRKTFPFSDCPTDRHAFVE
ncbi:hypothetical protein CKAH01_05916 [Colletotrichum kahawae]|uniref:Uncharacterized protein n=1 Tax=Colletotrichum kahawae TaxID=34407 RepID=A0AAE0D3R1_COLKA|nr:hypothetical protein CKAH01_05916 [Colletotrichum kahawae]